VAAERIASVSLSIAVGAGAGVVKGWTATSDGRVGWRIVTQFVVMDSVALGFIRRMFIFEVDMLVKECLRVTRPLEISWGRLEANVMVREEVAELVDVFCCG
jgi:hypothetical protein